MDNAALARLPHGAWQGPVHLILTIPDAENAVQTLLSESVVGFDVESRPVFTKGQRQTPALVQVAGTSAVFLFHVHHFKGQSVAHAGSSRYAGLSALEAALETLRPLVTSSAVVKTGVGVVEDARLIQRFARDMQPRGFADLAIAARRLQLQHSLRALCGSLLGFQLSKKAQMSNWERSPLTAEQVLYAATDAWVSRELYLQLVPMLLTAAPPLGASFTPKPPPPQLAAHAPSPHGGTRAHSGVRAAPPPPHFQHARPLHQPGFVHSPHSAPPPPFPPPQLGAGQFPPGPPPPHLVWPPQGMSHAPPPGPLFPRPPGPFGYTPEPFAAPSHAMPHGWGHAGPHAAIHRQPPSALPQPVGPPGHLEVQRRPGAAPGGGDLLSHTLARELGLIDDAVFTEEYAAEMQRRKEERLMQRRAISEGVGGAGLQRPSDPGWGAEGPS